MKVTIEPWFVRKNLTSIESVIYFRHDRFEIVSETERAYLLSLYDQNEQEFTKWFPKSVVTFDEEERKRKPRRELKKELNGVFGVEGLNRMTDFLKSWGVPVDEIKTVEEAERVINNYGLTEKWNEEK